MSCIAYVTFCVNMGVATIERVERAHPPSAA